MAERLRPSLAYKSRYHLLECDFVRHDVHCEEIMAEAERARVNIDL